MKIIKLIKRIISAIFKRHPNDWEIVWEDSGVVRGHSYSLFGKGYIRDEVECIIKYSKSRNKYKLYSYGEYVCDTPIYREAIDELRWLRKKQRNKQLGNRH